MDLKIDKNNLEGEIKLSSGHSMVLGHKPKKINIEDLSKQLQSENNCTQVESFGLWEVASPNYSTYYPDVTSDDLNPKDEEFITPVFRMLSEVIVSKGWRPIDFGKKGVLKKSMKMLLGQTVNIDHEVAVGNAVGAVSDVYWQEAYKTSSGIEVPAGINAILKIDGKSNPRIARGITMQPPSIHSNSVTVRFKWEPSHSLEDINEFYNLLGTFDSNGNMYRLVVNEIISYSETSLVSHGADPFAQKVNDKKEIVNPEYAQKQYSFSKDGSFSDFIDFSYKSEITLKNDNSIPKKISNINKPKEKLNMEEIIERFISEFNFSAGELNKDNLTEKLKEKFNTTVDEVVLLKREKKELQTKVDNLISENNSLKLNGDELKLITDNTIKEAERLYRLSKGEEVDENILSLISKSDLKTASSFVRTYQKEVDQKFKQTCSNCGSDSITRGSAQPSKDGVLHNGNEVKKDNKTLSVKENLKMKSKKKSIIFKNN